MKHETALTIHFESQRHILRVEVRGPGIFDNTVAYWKAIAAELREHPKSGLLLIDQTIGEPLSAAEWKSLVETLGSSLTGVRIVHVKPHGLERIEFCELYAREAGLDARVFTDEAEADLWLRYGERTHSD